MMMVVVAAPRSCKTRRSTLHTERVCLNLLNLGVVDRPSGRQSIVTLAETIWGKDSTRIASAAAARIRQWCL
jgi:hypothetical protein